MSSSSSSSSSSPSSLLPLPLPVLPHTAVIDAQSNRPRSNGSFVFVLSRCVSRNRYTSFSLTRRSLLPFFSVFFLFFSSPSLPFFFFVIYSHVFIYLFSIPSSSFPLFFPSSFSPFSFLPDNQRSIVPWTFRDVELCDERSNDRVTRCVPGGSGDDDRSQSRDPIRVNPVIGVLLSSGEYINK